MNFKDQFFSIQNPTSSAQHSSNISGPPNQVVSSYNYDLSLQSEQFHLIKEIASNESNVERLLCGLSNAIDVESSEGTCAGFLCLCLPMYCIAITRSFNEDCDNTTAKYVCSFNI